MMEMVSGETTSFDDVLHVIRVEWTRLEAEPRNGASQEEIDTFECRHNVRLPDAVRRFYQYVDGMEAWSTDNELISFWCLARLHTVPVLLHDFCGAPNYSAIADKLPEASTYFVFADYSIWCHVYAMRLTNDPSQPATVLWICGDQWYQVANSFEQFLRSYAESPLEVVIPLELQSEKLKTTIALERRSRHKPFLRHDDRR